MKSAMRPTTTSAATEYDSHEISRPKRSSCSFSGVFTLLSICAAVNTLPFSVASPTAETRKTPLPFITFVPFITAFDGNVASLLKCASSTVLWHKGSPVSVDSSTSSDTDSKRRPSAGISSPHESITTSPTTTSLRAISTTLELRITFTGSSSFT